MVALRISYWTEGVAPGSDSSSMVDFSAMGQFWQAGCKPVKIIPSGQGS